MYVWTIFDRPRDFPNGVIARRFRCVLPAPVPTSDTITGASVEAVRAEIERRYPDLVLFPCQPGDDPNIVETWL
jgi:hypothetical protein